MSRIFLSHRRDDSAGFAGRLSDALEVHFGAGAVFRDVDDIKPGEDFVKAIQAHLGNVGVVLVMIGPHWLATVGRLDGGKTRQVLAALFGEAAEGRQSLRAVEFDRDT